MADARKGKANIATMNLMSAFVNLGSSFMNCQEDRPLTVIHFVA
jgi:hypothetical protein